MADQPTFLQGLLGGLSNGTNPLVNLGYGLMQAGGPPAPFQNLGTSLMGANQQTIQNQIGRQNLGMNELNMQMLRARLPGLEAYYHNLGNLTNPPSAETASPAVPSATPFSPPRIPAQPQGAIDPMAALNTGTAGAAYGMPGAAELAKYPENMASVQKAAETQRQLESRGPMARLDTLASSPNPDQMIQSPKNADLLEDWNQVAPNFLGVHPQQGLNAQNVRAYARYQYNQWAGYGGKEPKEMPDIWDIVPGENGQSFLQSRATGKPVQLTDQKIPGFEAKTVTDPATGKEQVVMVQTGPGGAPPPIAALRQAAGAPVGPIASPSRGSVGAVGPPKNLGYAAPSTENIKQVGFAETMQNGLKTLRGLENQGYALNPSERAALIDIATNEDAGLLHNWVTQEWLKHQQDPNFQSYLAGMMPVIQAVSHDQSGARLNTTQIRANLESVIPIDTKNKQALATINGTRDSFQKAMNVGAGPAAFSPEFATSVGAQRQQAAAKQPMRVNNPAEALLLPKGTRFMTPDGRVKVR